MPESLAVPANLAEEKNQKRRNGEEQNENLSLPAARASLLRVIVVFLESSGFTRTLAALQSEVPLEIDDGSKDSGLDLEDILCKYLGLSGCSKDHVLESISGPEDEDYAQSGFPKKEKASKDQSEEPISKRRKKKTKGGDDDVEAESDKSSYENGKALPNQQSEELPRQNVPEMDYGTSGNQLPECHVKPKDKKGKKSKVYGGAIEIDATEKLETMIEETSKEIASLPQNSSGLLDESNVRSKDKKKKKNKLTSDLLDGVIDQVGAEASQEEKRKCKELESECNSQVPNATSENLMGEYNSKSKDWKKRKHKFTVESSSGDCAELQSGSKSEAGKKEKSTSHDIEEDAKESAAKIENFSSLENTDNVDKKTKKKKNSASEETEVPHDTDAAGQASKHGKPEDLIEQDVEEAKRLDDSLPKSDLCAHGKKRKREKSEEESEKSTKIPVNNQSQVPNDAKETFESSGQNEKKEQQQIIGNLCKNEAEGNGSLKSSKADLKPSAVPKTVNAFKRVKVYEDGAETGYGAKAQEILGQVRGISSMKRPRRSVVLIGEAR